MPNSHKIAAALAEFKDMLEDGTHFHLGGDANNRPLLEIGSGAPSGTGGPTRGLIYINRAAANNNTLIYYCADTGAFEAQTT
jgi:hypothetical protein